MVNRVILPVLVRYWGVALLILTTLFVFIFNLGAQQKSEKIKVVQEKGTFIKIYPKKLLQEYKKIENEITRKLAATQCQFDKRSVEEFFAPKTKPLPSCQQQKNFIIKSQTSLSSKYTLFFFSLQDAEQRKMALSQPPDTYLIASGYKNLQEIRNLSREPNRHVAFLQDPGILAQLSITCLPAKVEIHDKNISVFLLKVR